MFGCVVVVDKCVCEYYVVYCFVVWVEVVCVFVYYLFCYFVVPCGEDACQYLAGD